MIVKDHLTQMINLIIAVKERDAVPVAVLTVKTIFREPNHQITAPIATPSSLEFTVRIIILQAINAKRIKRAISVRVSIP